MVSLSLMARLVEAVRPDARLVLVGDPGQLTSIEAGAVLGDIVGPATVDAHRRPRPRPPLRRRHRPPGRRDPRRRRRRGDLPSSRPSPPTCPGSRSMQRDPRPSSSSPPSARRPWSLGRAVIAAAQATALPTTRSPPSTPSECSAPTAAERTGSPRGRPGSRAGWLRRSPASTPTAACVRRPAAARHRERLRAAPLQRRHRRRRPDRPRPRQRGLRARRRAARRSPRRGSERSRRSTR